MASAVSEKRPRPERVEEPASAIAPVLPPGYRLQLPGRGTTFVRRVRGPRADAPTVLLLHGWIASGGLNWFQAFKPLSEHFRVIAPDLRGHGRGIRSHRRFRLADCADDVAETLEILDTGPVIAVGYSLGGPVAQLLWRRHRHLVNGLVLCATGAEFIPGNRERYAMTAMMTFLAGTSRVGRPLTIVPRFIGRSLLGLEPATGRAGVTASWARQEMTRHSMRMIAEAGHAVSTYSSKAWIHEVDVPTSVVVTENDRAVSPEAQLRMAMAIPGAHINRIPDGHVACTNPTFGRKITDACLDVQHRIDTGWHPAESVFAHAHDHDHGEKAGSLAAVPG